MARGAGRKPAGRVPDPAHAAELWQDAEAVSALRAALLAWYREVRRDLPWRRTSDPYAIWLSEVMLQQTRVDTVIPYWRRFLGRFPTVEALAEAPLDDVLSEWAGLGYYRRARLLHGGAKALAARPEGAEGGRFPRDVEGLLAVPGIGRYTAGAVASIAFGVRAPLVDGNVERVLARRFGLDDDVRGPVGKRRVWAAADALVPADAPGDFNQALMELGATVCTPKAPRCDACPLAPACVARAEGRASTLPVIAKKKPPSALAQRALVVVRGRPGRTEVLLGQRHAALRFGGLWEPPCVGVATSDGQGVLAEEAAAALAFEGARAGTFVHVLSHRRLEVEVWLGRTTRRGAGAPEPFAPYAKLVWTPVEALREAEAAAPGVGGAGRAAPRGVALSRLARRALEVAGVG